MDDQESISLTPSQQTMADIRDKHTQSEFETRSAEDALDTMVEDPHVNYIPVLTGGVGRAEVRKFYSERFIPQQPTNTQIVPISRTVGHDRPVDELVFKFTHDVDMDWMLLGISPTGQRVEVPLVVVIQFRNDKIAHEHIYWDQASVLVQLGLIDAERLPVAGIESARKVLDPTLSNELIERADEGK